jgi:hypothetical protein
MAVPIDPVHQWVATQEVEITALRNSLVVNSQFAAAFPGSPAIMSPIVSNWILARIKYLMSLQLVFVGPNAVPPTIPVPTLADLGIANVPPV